MPQEATPIRTALLRFYHQANATRSDAAYMSQLSDEEALEYLKKHHSTTQMSLLGASQQFRHLRELAGLPQESKT